MQALPIDDHLPKIVAALVEHNRLLIEAPPGTGKTTRAAPAMLRLPGSGAEGKVNLVQPRRIAARAAAARIASELGVRLGEQVGYQVRFDARVTAATQLVAMTPGILLRHLQSDAVLQDVAVVVLDEFHERSLEVDLLLGMLRRLQSELRPELRLVLMSATLDTQAVADFLDSPPIIRVSANSFPVKIQHARFQSLSAAGGKGGASSPSRRIVEQTTAVTLQAVQETTGDVLVFLPGVGEILQVERNLRGLADKQNCQLMTLFGELSAQEQDRVLSACDRRKIILSTNVAETSLTIDGVQVVVDSGWARVQRIDPSIGLNVLRLEPISKASADQRAGRAGRTAPGSCFRLWDEITGRSRPAYLEPEILRVDLCGAILQLLCWGETDMTAFPWLTPPRESAVAQAFEVLSLLGAISDRTVTPLGRQLNSLPLQPRLARLLVEGQQLGIARTAALAAAILSERDVFDRRSRQNAQPTRTTQAGAEDWAVAECDISRRVQALQEFSRTGRTETPLGDIKPGAAGAVLQVAERLWQSCGGSNDSRAGIDASEQLRRALLTAFPDRLAKRRTAGAPRGLLVAGRGVKLDSASAVKQSELFLCLDVDAAGSEAHVRKASAIEAAWLPIELLEQRDERFFNPTLAAIVTRRRLYFLDLVLEESPTETPADQETAMLLAKAAAERFDRLLPAKDKFLHSWLARVRWLAHEMPEGGDGLPSFAASDLVEPIAGWCFGMRRLDELSKLPWASLLPSLLSPEARRMLDQHAPESIRLPSGRSVLLQYEMGRPPVLAARIQEFLGWKETPRLAGGRVPLLLHLLAPNGRVQQITDDLAGFWSKTYVDVRKQLRGRYPKHAWPEDPLSESH